MGYRHELVRRALEDSLHPARKRSLHGKVLAMLAARPAAPAARLAHHASCACRDLASWLWRAGALEDMPAEIAEPYAMEISGDWHGAAHVWKTLGCPYEHAIVLGWYGGEPE